jgi:hypothetical protein
MSFFVDAPREEAFQRVTDYLIGRRMEILSSNSPSYIKAKIGSWSSMSPGDERGEVRADIVEGKDGSYINLNFDFSITYIGGFMFGIIGALIVYYISVYLVPSEIRSILWQSLTILLAGLPILLIPAIIAWDVSITKKKFIDEFNMFIQSLSSKK